MPERTDASTTPDFKTALGDQLVVAHGRLSRRRRRRQGALVVAAVAVLALFTTTALAALRPDPAAADPISVSAQDDGSLKVTIEQADALPAQLQAALLAKGIDNDTRGQPTGPSRVGTVISVAFTGQPQSRPTEAITRSLIVPPNFTGKVLLVVGQPAARGLPYAQPSVAFDAGEPLAGFGRPDDVAAVVAAASELQLRVTITDADGQPIAPAAVPARALVASAIMTSSQDLSIRLRR